MTWESERTTVVAAESGMPAIVAAGEEESSWLFWPDTQEANTGGRCECGHEGLGPNWHEQSCPGVLHAWVMRARSLHDELWRMRRQRGAQVEQVAEESPPIPEDDGE